MGEGGPTGLAERERLLLMAAYLHGTGPGEEIRANCWAVLRQALLWAGALDAQMDADTRQDVTNPVIEDWYGTLIGMIRRDPQSGPLVEGRGNFGTDRYRSAFPSYTGCALTGRGRDLAERLFAEYPQFRAELSAADVT